jgi:hypothetical protein
VPGTTGAGRAGQALALPAGAVLEVLPPAGTFGEVLLAGAELDVDAEGLELEGDGVVDVWILGAGLDDPQPFPPGGPALPLTPVSGALGEGVGDGEFVVAGDVEVTGGDVELTGELDGESLGELLGAVLDLDGAGEQVVAGDTVATPPGLLPPLPDEPVGAPLPVSEPPPLPPVPVPPCAAEPPLCTEPSEEAVFAVFDARWLLSARPTTATIRTAAPMAATGRTQLYRGRAACPGRAAAGRNRPATAPKAAATGSSHRRRPAYQAEADSNESIGRLSRSRIRSSPSADGSIESAAACRARRRASS